MILVMFESIEVWGMNWSVLVVTEWLKTVFSLKCIIICYEPKMLVLDQINKLLHPSDPETQREANNYLTKWQRTIEAWAESHAILNGNFPLEAKFIAAQTLRIKILYDFYQLPSDCFLKICESLLSYLNQDGLPRNISSTVGLAICDMAIQMAESWDSPVESFVNYYKSNRLSLEVVLYLLETLPEETSNNRLILIPELHTKVTFKLKSEYVKVVEFLSLVRNNLPQLASKMNPSGLVNNSNMGNVLNYKLLGKILKVWTNWRRYDTFSSSGDMCRNFLNDCLEIIKNPNYRNEGAVEDIYETSVDCMVDLLQECAYLTNRSSYSSSVDDSDYEGRSEVSANRYNDLVEVQKACFNVLVKEMNNHLIEAFKQRDVVLLNNLSRLFVNLVESVNIDHNSTDPDTMILIDYLVKFIELPYLLLYSDTTLSDFVNPFRSDYSHVKAREVILNALINSKTSALFENVNSSGCSSGNTTMYLDDEVCNISQKCSLILIDILAKFSKTLADSVENVTSVNLLTTTMPGLFPYLLSNILQLLLLVTVSPYQLYLAPGNVGMAERIKYTEFMDNYSLYISEVTDLVYELLRIVNKNAVFDYFRANVLNLPNFANSPVLIQSLFLLLPPSLIMASISSFPKGGNDLYRTENIKVVGQLLMIIESLFKMNEVDLGGTSADVVLMVTMKINCVKFLGQVKKIFGHPDTQYMLTSVFSILSSQLSIKTARSPREEMSELYAKLRYESGYSISLVCCHVKMDKLSNNKEILSILLNSLEGLDNELLIMILEGLAISCYNLHQNDLLIVFNQVLTNTMTQLVNVINTLTPNQAAVQNLGTDSKQMIIKLLNRIVGFVRNLRDKPELDPIVGERIFPVLIKLLQLFCMDNDLVEATCRCIKHNARVLGVYFAKYIPTLVQTISQVAQVKMFGTYLYLIEWLHSIFYSNLNSRREMRLTDPGKTDASEKEIMNLYKLLTVLTLNIFKMSYHNYPTDPKISSGTMGHDPTKTNKDMEENELLIEDFYGLQAEFFMDSDKYLNDLGLINDIINCACKFLFIKRPHCVFCFWESLLRTSRYNPEIAALTSQYLQTTLNNCFVKLNHGCSKSTEHYIESLVTNIMGFVKSTDFKGLQPTSNGHTIQPITPEDKDKYIESLLNNALANLPVEIISNDKLRQSFLNGLMKKTKSTINHIYKLSAKLSMRNRI